MKNLFMPPPWLDSALEFSITKTQKNLEKLETFPERTENGKWLQIPPEKHGWWVGGHWVGMLWLALNTSKDPIFEKASRDWASRLLPVLHADADHDLGFLFGLGFALGYRITDDESLKSTAIQAAEILRSRFNPRGRFIQAWGPRDVPAELRGRTIVDTMMNLDLLFWVGQETGDPSFSEIAAAHAHTPRARHIRPDGSSAHVCDFDPDSGQFLRQAIHQGLSGTSCWNRGQSWAVYGFATCYQAAGDADFLEASRRLIEYIWPRLPSDLVPYWDYDSPLIPEDVRDSSAPSILASGLLHLSKVEDDPELAKLWRRRAELILESLWLNYASQKDDAECLLHQGTRSKPQDMMDHGLIYGDYYFFEALCRLNKTFPAS